MNSYNLYYGWYLGELDQNDDFFDTYHKNIPTAASVFRSTARTQTPPTRAPTPESGDYTETYQCVYHEHMAKMIADRPWHVGDPCLE